jgi:hypothetical protein
MKNPLSSMIIILLSACINSIAVSEDEVALQKSHFWDRTKRGTNIFNRQVCRDDIKAAKNMAYGLSDWLWIDFPVQKGIFSWEMPMTTRASIKATQNF